MRGKDSARRAATEEGAGASVSADEEKKKAEEKSTPSKRTRARPSPAKPAKEDVKKSGDKGARGRPKKEKAKKEEKEEEVESESESKEGSGDEPKAGKRGREEGDKSAAAEGGAKGKRARRGAAKKEEGEGKEKKERKPRKPREKKKKEKAGGGEGEGEGDGGDRGGRIEVRRGEVDLNEGIGEDPDIVDTRFVEAVRAFLWLGRGPSQCFKAWHTPKVGLMHEPGKKGWGVRAFETIKGGEQIMIIPARLAPKGQMEPIEDLDRARSIEDKFYRIRVAAVVDPGNAEKAMWSYVEHYDDWDNFYTRINHGHGRARNATELEWTFQYEGQDLLGMGLFATRTINPGDEVLIDYRTNTDDFVGVFPWLAGK